MSWRSVLSAPVFLKAVLWKTLLELGLQCLRRHSRPHFTKCDEPGGVLLAIIEGVAALLMRPQPYPFMKEA